MQGQNGTHGSRLPFQALPRHLVEFKNQLRKDGVSKDGFIGMLESRKERQEVPTVLPCFHFTNDKESVLKVQVKGDKDFWDDLTGQLLDPELVKAARKTEME